MKGSAHMSSPFPGLTLTLHPPVADPRAAEGLPPHPPLRPAGERREGRQPRARPQAARRRSAGARARRRFRSGHARQAVPVLRLGHAHHRGVQGRRARATRRPRCPPASGSTPHEPGQPHSPLPCRSVSPVQNGPRRRSSEPHPASPPRPASAPLPSDPSLIATTRLAPITPPATSSAARQPRPRRNPHRPRGTVAPHIPRVPSLKAFGRRPRPLPAPPRSAVVRNPQQVRPSEAVVPRLGPDQRSGIFCVKNLSTSPSVE